MPAFNRVPARLSRVSPLPQAQPGAVAIGRQGRAWYQRAVRDTEPRPDDRPLAKQALEHLDALYAFAWRLSRDRHVAEDLVQETFARGLAGSQSFVPGTHLKAWLFRILRNAFLDQRRREGRSPLRAVSEVPEAGVAADSPLPGTPSDVKLEQLRHLVARDIDAALSALSDDHRAVVLLDFEGFSEQDIAEVMDCAAGTVKSRLARARAALREQLREYAR
jgi:RNA polymerase sigma-70 factor (ECF subfamily)